MSRRKTDAPFAALTKQPSLETSLSTAFSAALGALPGSGKGLQAGRGVLSRPDQLNKAPKPSGGPNRTASLRKGHR